MNPCEHGSGRTCQEPHFRFGRDAFHRVPSSAGIVKDAVERVLTGFITAAYEPRSSRRKEALTKKAESGKRKTENERSLLTSAATVAWLPLLCFLLTPLLSLGQANDAISREVSIFNFGLPSITTNIEAISREVSVFNYGVPSVATNLEAVSREVSIFNYDVPLIATNQETISREISVFNYGVPFVSTNLEAIAREVSLFNYGVPPIAFSIGSTNALKDQPNQVPFTFQTILDLTNVSLTLQADDSRLQILGITPVAPEIISTSLGAVVSNNHPIAFTLNPAAIPATNHLLAWLNFQGKTNLESAVVPLTVTDFAANRTSGQFAPGATTNGQVILIVNQPILFPTNRLPLDFTMYGIPGATYAIQATTNLVPAFWIEVQRLLETGPTLSITGLTNRGSQQFYRAQQVGP